MREKQKNEDKEVAREYDQLLSNRLKRERQRYQEQSRLLEATISQTNNYFDSANSLYTQDQGATESPANKLWRKYEMMDQENRYNLQLENPGTQISSNNSWNSNTDSSPSRLKPGFVPVTVPRSNCEDKHVEPLAFGSFQEGTRFYFGGGRQQKADKFSLLDRTGYLELDPEDTHSTPTRRWNPDINQSRAPETQAYGGSGGGQEFLRGAGGGGQENEEPGVFDSVIQYIKDWANSFGREEAAAEPDLRMRRLQPGPLEDSRILSAWPQDANMLERKQAVPQQKVGLAPARQSKTRSKYFLKSSAGTAGTPIEEDFEFH